MFLLNVSFDFGRAYDSVEWIFVATTWSWIFVRTTWSWITFNITRKKYYVGTIPVDRNL